MKNFKLNLSGQALIELAIFGSVVLFALAALVQYGLSANYYQNFKMQSFRETLALSANRSANNANPAVSLVVIKDKAIPDPQDPIGIPETSPYGANFSEVQYSNTLQVQPLQVSGVDYKINDKWQGIKGQSDLPTYNRPGYYSEGLKFASCVPGTTIFHQRKQRPGASIWWEWKDIPCEKAEENALYDVDNDYVEELVVEKVEQCANDMDADGNPIQNCGIRGFYALDPNSGDIDSQYGTPMQVNGLMVVKPYVDSNGIEIRQGLQPGYTKQVSTAGSYLKRDETKKGITDETNISTTETITRKVKLNEAKFANPEQEVKSELTKQKKKSWFTPF